MSEQPQGPVSIPPPGGASSAMGVPFSSTAATQAPQAVGPEPSGGIHFDSPRPPARTGALTWSAVYFYFHAAIGCLSILAIIASLSSSEAGLNPLGLIFGLAFAGPFIYGDYIAGKRLWELDPKGRGIGMFMSGLGVFSGLVWAARAPVMLFSGILAAVVFFYLWKTDDLGR